MRRRKLLVVVLAAPAVLIAAGAVVSWPRPIGPGLSRRTSTIM
jgi:hypothetical protein